ncbi:MAG: nucleotidyltransferase family protein [Oscillospiraceae bacterium]|jgi:hypothetical protein|nr:nucleotidyltransferase family protein [Oscillospiraceae bacterium]
MDIELDIIKSFLSEITNDDVSSVLYDHKCYDIIFRLPNSTCFDKACKKYIFNKKRMEIYYKEIKPLLEQLGIPFAIVKGVVLSQTAYGNPFIRNSGDIDILVAPQDISKVYHVMKKNNFIQGTIINGGIVAASREKRVYQTFYSHQLLPFIKKTDSCLCPYICVDINTNIVWGENNNKIDMQELLSHREIINIEGIGLYKLDPINEFIALCLHHYKDMNSIYLLYQGSLNLKLYLDIYRYIQHQENNLLINELHARANNLNVLPYVFYCIEQTAQLFPDRILKFYSNSLKTTEGEILLNRFGLDDREQKIWKFPLLERLFSVDFHEKFISMLSEDDVKKINLNISMMH